jgi:hypothetical protein
MISFLLFLTVTILLIVAGLAANGGTNWSLKIELQNFFFWGLTALIIQIWIGGSLLLSHKKVIKTISRLSAFDDLNSSNADKSFRELGSLGEEIKKVLKRENQLSVMRALRISALNNLANLLCEGYSEPVIVTDITGKIFTISEKLRTRIIKESKLVQINNIFEIRPEIKLSEILGFIEKQKTAWKDPENTGLICSPVFDKTGVVQFCIWEFETSFFAGKLKELNQQKSKIQPSYKRIREIVNPFLRKKK